MAKKKAAVKRTKTKRVTQVASLRAQLQAAENRIDRLRQEMVDRIKYDWKLLSEVRNDLEASKSATSIVEGLRNELYQLRSTVNELKGIVNALAKRRGKR